MSHNEILWLMIVHFLLFLGFLGLHLSSSFFPSAPFCLPSVAFVLHSVWIWIVISISLLQKLEMDIETELGEKVSIKQFDWKTKVTLILTSLSDSFFCLSASFRLRLSSSLLFLFSSSLSRFFSSSLLLRSSLFSSLILCTDQKLVSIF